jgi:hypothetical protein
VVFLYSLFIFKVLIQRAIKPYLGLVAFFYFHF